MDKTNINLISRILTLYCILPRAPKLALAIEQFKDKVRHYYDNEIEEKSFITRVVRKDDEAFVLFDGWSHECRQAFSGRIVLKKRLNCRT